MDERLSAFKRLLDIMDAVRAGCPWDSTQTIQSLRHLTIEETYELSQAILNDDLDDVKKELGDLMLHLVFYAKIGQEQGAFDITDVLNGICEKMIVRHPHIFGNEHVENAEQVEQNWEKIKLEREHNRSVLGGVPEGLPSLLKAYRMAQKTAGVGFRWPDAEQAWQKVEEEKKELFAELQKPDNQANIEAEYGDLLFALAAYGNYIGVNSDDALEKTNKKFRERFTYVEQKAREQGQGVQQPHHILLPQRLIRPILTLQDHRSAFQHFDTVPLADGNTKRHTVAAGCQVNHLRYRPGIIIKDLPQMSPQADHRLRRLPVPMYRQRRARLQSIQHPL